MKIPFSSLPLLFLPILSVTLNFIKFIAKHKITISNSIFLLQRTFYGIFYFLVRKKRSIELPIKTSQFGQS